MATKTKDKPKTQEKPKTNGATPTIVTVSDLEKETGIPGMKIRQAIRSLGKRAPAVEGQQGFGPRAKYGWAEGSQELAEIREAVSKIQYDPNAPKKERKAKGEKKAKGSKAKEEAADEDDDEDEDPEDDGDDDGEDDE